MKGELSSFYRGVASGEPRGRRILSAGLIGAVLSIAAGRGLEASRFRFDADWQLIGSAGSLLLIVCTVAWVWFRRLRGRVRVGQITLLHRRRGMVELELGPGEALRRDARRLARWTRDIDSAARAELRLFVRTAVWTEERLKKLGFETRSSAEPVRLAGYFAYTVRWIGWAFERAMKWKKPPKFVQRDRYIEGEMDLDRFVRRWSGPAESSGSGPPRDSYGACSTAFLLAVQGRER